MTSGLDRAEPPPGHPLPYNGFINLFLYTIISISQRAIYIYIYIIESVLRGNLIILLICWSHVMRDLSMTNTSSENDGEDAGTSASWILMIEKQHH